VAEAEERLPFDECKALADPVRWAILARGSETDQVACQELDSLPVSKPTISYHLKILQQAGLISIRKEGRNSYYSLEREALHRVMDALSALAPAPRPPASAEPTYLSSRRPRRPDAIEGSRNLAGEPPEAPAHDHEAVVLTW
jgi:DNA-binding transcriptional ArsR family regulator